jgi:[ribosomal protein S18]-alanine N-acetyltransferase
VSRVFIDEAGPGDLDALAAVDRVCATHPWPAAHFQSEMDPGNRARVLAAREMDPAGTATVVGFCAYRLVADEVHVHNLGVAPAQRRRGLGRLLLRMALQAAVRAEARWAMLEVRASNEAARRLYEAEGFREVAERRAYYREPVEDAVILRRGLSRDG